jgi:nucleotide-binding universal stress UspA family protein
MAIRPAADVRPRVGHQYTLLVPVNRDAACLDAVSLACTVARQRKGRLFAVHVIEVARSLPLNADMDAEARRGEQSLRKAEVLARDAGLSLVGDLVQARTAGQGIVDEARDRDADVIVLAVEATDPGAERGVGATAEYVLQNAACDVWVVRRGQNGRHAHDNGEEHL